MDGLGNTLRRLLTGGQASEYGQFQALIEGYRAEHVLGDKGYDSDKFIRTVEMSGATEKKQKAGKRI